MTDIEAEASTPGPVEPSREDQPVPHRALPVMALAALGVVFGDIGTSPIYALQTVFAIDQRAVLPDHVDVFGILSLMFWSVMVVVSFKYVILVMRADNEGEGGILALVALLRRKLGEQAQLSVVITLFGIVGAALFYGDSVITPAISVMSAVEGLTLVNQGTERFVLPASVLILTALFVAQRFGTQKIGRAFGPIMVVWFAVLAAMGLPHIIEHPRVLAAVSPQYALAFIVERPFIAFVALGAVVLCITGAEALYADMGHFGKGPIRLSWFSAVLPALMLNYFGQGAMILADPSTAASPFFNLVPTWLVIPLVLLATIATIIASQAVISGAFSVSSQASRLGLLPRLTIRHTSREEGGQIYIPSINWMLYLGVLALIAMFRSSGRLANAYGLAVTGTLLLTTTIFLFLARRVWRWPAWKMLLVTIPVGGLETLYLAANLVKIPHGGWLPLVVGVALTLVMTTWRLGARERARARTRLEGPLPDFIEKVYNSRVRRVEGLAVFPHPDAMTTPLALKENLRFNRVLHETVIIVTVEHANVPHVRHVDRATVNDLGHDDDGIFHITYRVGFNDSQDIPRAIEWGLLKKPEMDYDPSQARYFLSVLRLKKGPQSRLSAWRRDLFLALAAAEADRTTAFHLPPDRTVIMGGEVKV